MTESPRWLLDGLVFGDVFFASPSRQWRARRAGGMTHALAPAAPGALASLFARARAEGVAAPVLFGLVPFDASRPASLTVPHQLETATTPPHASASAGDGAGAGAHRPGIAARAPLPAPEVYGDMVRRALALFAAGDVQKIVLSRAMDVTLAAPPHYPTVLADLLRRNAHGYTFALPAWGTGGDAPLAAMLAASPELLVRREGAQVFINPLAGSIPRHPDPAEDERRRQGLAASEKDLREHGYVVGDIVRVLRQHCDALDVPAGPSVIGTDALWHLSTFITGRLKDPATTALDLALELHPTPAICGYPTAAAFGHIRALEPFDREYFAGLAGWQREGGDGEWVLSLRTARHDGERGLRLYAGAGTVAGSDPESEIRETATKMETFMRALG